MNSLKGYRTYIVAAIIAVVNIAVALGWISPANLDQINMVLGALGITALRSAIK